MPNRLALIGLIGTIMVAALAIGCPNSGAKKASNARTIVTQPTKVAETPGTNKSVGAEENATQETEGTGKAQTASDSSDKELVASEDTLEFPRRADDPDLEGKWFALFGHHDLGVMTHSWVDGHNVEFRKNGQAFWYKVVNGAEVGTLDSQWNLRGNQLMLSFSAVKAVESGLSKVAPLGIGKDEEIGLTNTPAPGMNASAMVLLDTVLDLELDHNYLVLRDGYSRLMVYGRDANEVHGIPEEWDGDWVGKGKGERRIAAQFEMQGDVLKAQMDHRTRRFSGELVNGYYVGDLIGPNGSDLVAFFYDELGFLDGVIYPKPYRQVSMDYEFMKAPKGN